MRSVMHPVARGTGVHKKRLACTIIITESMRMKPVYHHHKSSTHDYGLMKLVDWPDYYDCHCVCMESAGKYWIPVFNYSRNRSFNVIITHPKYAKSPEGERINFLDSVHIAELFQMGKVQPSYVPNREFHRLCDLSHYRYKITNFMSPEKNRIQDYQTVSNVSLVSIVSNPFGVDASAVFSELLASDDIDEVHIKFLLRGSLKKKSEKILNSIGGFRLDDDQSCRSLLSLGYIQFLENMKSALSNEADKKISRYHAYADLVTWLPGIGHLSTTTLAS